MSAGSTPPAGGREWVQVNCSVFVEPSPAGPVPFIPWARLSDAVAAWRQDRRFSQFNFVRKPPGLRLRFAVDERGRLEEALAVWLTEAEDRNDIRGFRFMSYEPETFRFGGPVGMAVAHDLFDADAQAALRVEGLAAEGLSAAVRTALSAALTMDLLGTVLDDADEAWDVWCQLRESTSYLRAAPPVDGQPAIDAEALALLDAAVAEPARFEAAIPGDGKDLFREARRANQAVGATLRATARAGCLDRGARSWLAAATPFHWNRWGLSMYPALLVTMLDRAVELTDPDRRRDRGDGSAAAP